MIATFITGAATWLADAIDTSSETRRAQEAAATEAAAQRLITPAVSLDLEDETPAPAELSPRQAKTRAAVQRLIGGPL